MSKILYEGTWRYLDLALTNLTSEKTAGSFLPSDDLQFSTGSLSLNSDVIAEHWNGVQFSFEAVVGTYFIPGDGLVHYLFDNQGTGASEDRIRCYIDAAGLLTFVVHDTDSTQHLVSHDVTDWKQDEEHYVACTLDFNANTIVLYVDGTAEDSTPDNALSSDSVAAIEANTHIGSDNAGANYLNGKIKYRFWNRVLSATEITAQWNSGAMVEFSIVSQDVIAIDDFTNSATGVKSKHSGKAVSAISAGGTEATLTTADGADVFADGDAVLVSDATGYSKPGFADGAGSGTSLDVDDGAGAAVADIEKVGVSIDCDDQYAGNGGDILDAGTNDVSLSAWVQLAEGAGNGVIIGKWDGVDSTPGYYLYSADGVILMKISDGSGVAIPIGTTDIRDGKRHHVAGYVDRDTVADSKIFVDGYDDTASTYISGDSTGTLNNSEDFYIGRRNLGASILFWDGKIADAKVYIANGALWSAAQILYQATHPHDVSASAGTITEYYPLNENTGTTITAGVTSPGNDLTLSNVAAWDQEAHVSKDLWNNGGFEN